MMIYKYVIRSCKINCHGCTFIKVILNLIKEKYQL
jgi:hypothetical protein